MRSALLALLALGCTKSGSEAPPPARSADGCLAAAREVASGIAASPLGPLPPSASRLACPELYRRAGCASAWSALYEGDLSRASPFERIDRVVTACAAAYCKDLPGRVRACGPDAPAGNRDEEIDLLIELDRAVLIAETFDAATADKLSRRSILLREVTVRAPPRADAGPPEPALVLTIAIDGRMLLGDAAVATADLPGALGKAAATHHSLVIAADKKVPYQRVVEVLEQAKQAGFEQLAIQAGGAAP